MLKVESGKGRRAKGEKEKLKTNEWREGRKARRMERSLPPSVGHCSLDIQNLDLIVKKRPEKEEEEEKIERRI